MALLGLFWRKKQPNPAVIPELILAEPESPAGVAVTKPDADRAREDLKILRLERQIVGSALTTIFESHSKGSITEDERNGLLGKYRSELKQLEEKIGERQRVVDLFDLQNEREQVSREFKAKLNQIDSKIRALQPGYRPPKEDIRETKLESEEKKETEEKETKEKPQKEAAEEREKKPKDESKSPVEQRLEAIREEVLKAMERLEKIEAEEEQP